MTASSPAKNRVCLWYDNDAQGAAAFYASIFPATRITAIHRAPSDYPDGQAGNVLTVEFTCMGIEVIGLNGGPTFRQSEAFSFQVETEDQKETDRYWNAIVENGGEESQCGWCRDKWGVSWQITPRILSEAMTSSDKAAAKRAMDTMMTMRKINVAAIERAFSGDLS